MIVDFKSILHDSYGKVEQPVLTLKTPDGRIISTISNYSGLQPTFRFNDVSEVKFTVPAFFEGEINNGYNDIIGMRLVEVEPFGDFILVNPIIQNDGGRKEIKECTAYSLEYAFNYKKAEIPAGTYNFYNPVDNADTISNMIVELMPDWKLGNIDRELIGRWRTFDNVDDNLYAFMMNTLQESYNCIFQFDTFNKTINVMSANRSAYKLPIYLSYNNLVKSVEITELSDEIVTALSGYGSGDEVNIRSVNPNGTNTIYNLDYFISNGDLPESLADKWRSYDDSLELYRKVFSNLNILYLEKVNEYNLAKAKLSIMQSERDALKTTYLTAQTTVGNDAQYDAEIEQMRVDLETKEVKIGEQEAHIDMLDGDIEAINTQINDIISICKITSYFTPDEVKILSQYFKQDSIADDTFVIPEYSSSILQSSSNALTEDNNAKVKVVGAELYASNIAEIFTTDEFGEYQIYKTDPETGETGYNAVDLTIFHETELPEDIAQTIVDQLNDEAKRKVYEFRGGNFEFTYQEYQDVDGITTPVDVLLKGDVVNVNLHHNVDNLLSWEDEDSPDITKEGFFVLTATLRNAEYRGISYPNMNVSMQGMLLKEKPQIGDEFISFEIKDAVIYNTASNTEYQKQVIIQELYDYIQDSLEKLAFPSYEFSVESGNFIFAQEFEAFKDQLELGSTINLALDDNEDNIIQPILIEVGMDYDNESEFTITFSNKYRSSSSQFQLADLITEINRTSHSTTLNKGDYRAYKDSKAGNQVENLTTSALDVTRNKIINSLNQSIEWDSTGMFFRKTLPNGTFDPKQIGMINDNIAFTKDNWKNVEIAIGAYEDPNLGEGYGIIAPAIFGTLLAGENLVIENTVDDGAGNTVKQFKVDATGAWLHNSSLAFTQEADPNTGYGGGKILIDPRYGIAAGNPSLFTLDGTDISPTFWDKETNKIVWDESEVVETADGSVYYVPLNTQFYFDINSGNAYFSGTINGKNIVAETINGEAIEPGSLSGNKLIDGSVDAGSKLSGDISSDQMYMNILNSINRFADIAADGDQISLNLIGGLTNLNFEGGKITADSVDAANISGDLIQAINASIGTINTDKLSVTTALEAAKVIIAGENGKLAITPEYGIIAGNANLFTLNEDGEIVPTYLDEENNLIFDETTKAPLNSAFYFDINTGKAYFAGSIDAAQIKTGKLSSDYLDVKDAFITNAMIENMSADKISGGTITGDLMQANVISAINSYTGTATINHAKIGDLTADKIKSGTLDCSQLTVTGTIDANVANITNINAGNIAVDTIDSNFSNSVVGQIGNAVIKDAMIDKLSFNKLTGIDVNTTNLTIHSENGRSQWADNTITISDGTTTRVQIGEDASHDYNMYIWDADGTLMFDALGLTEGGIQRAIIKNAMVADNANISASKLDISSLFNVINNDNSHTIKGTKIYLNDENQTLSAAFTSLTTTVGEHGDAISSQGTAIEAVQGQITSKVWQQDITPVADNVSNLQTQYSTISQDLSSVTTKVSNVETTLDGNAEAGVKGLVERVSEAEAKITDEAIINTVSSTYSTKAQTVVDVEVLYVNHTSATVAPAETAPWSEVAPEWEDGKYMWQMIKYVYANGSQQYSAPTCITGATGAQGQDGTSMYTHIRYSANANGSGMVATPTSATKYIGVYTGTSATAPITTSSYKWSKYMGEDGQPGQDGTSSYTHIRYSANADGSSFVTTPTATTKYIGIYTGTSSSAPSDKASYKWNKYVGENGQDGADGKGIRSTAITYQTGASGTDKPTGTWSSTIPQVSAAKPYFWTKTVITYTDGNTSEVYTVGATIDGLELGGVNRFVQKTITRGSYLSDTGATAANNDWGHSDYILVEGWGHYIASGFTNLGISPATCFYDANKTYISGVRSGVQNSQDSARRTLPIPTNAKYMRFSFILNDLTKLKIERGTKATDYSPAPEDVDNSIQAVKTTAEQTATGFSWLVSGNNTSNFALTENALTAIANNIDLTGKVTFSDFDATSDGFGTLDGKTVISGNRILTGSLEVGINLDEYVSDNNSQVSKINEDIHGSIKLDEHGNPVLKLDENDQPIPVLDDGGNQVYDENNQPVYEYEYNNTGIYQSLSDVESKLTTDIGAIQADYAPFKDSTVAALQTLAGQMGNVYTKSEIDSYIRLMLSNNTGSISPYGSLFKYITVDPLVGLLIKGFDVDESAPTTTRYEYEYVFSDELGQEVYQVKKDAGGNPIVIEEPALIESPYSVNINNTSFRILNNNNPVTTIVGNTMNIDNANVETTLRLGDYVYKQLSNASNETTLNFFYEPQ